MMITQIENTPDGYVVGIYLRDEYGMGHWHRLRNFGDSEGDAKAFRDIDLPELTDVKITALIRQYDHCTVYRRAGKNRYIKQESL